MVLRRLDWQPLQEQLPEAGRKVRDASGSPVPEKHQPAPDGTRATQNIELVKLAAAGHEPFLHERLQVVEQV